MPIVTKVVAIPPTHADTSSNRLIGAALVEAKAQLLEEFANGNCSDAQKFTYIA